MCATSLPITYTCYPAKFVSSHKTSEVCVLIPSQQKIRMVFGDMHACFNLSFVRLLKNTEVLKFG